VLSDFAGVGLNHLERATSSDVLVSGIGTGGEQFLACSQSSVDTSAKLLT
jgi:hypothetical protein